MASPDTDELAAAPPPEPDRPGPAAPGAEVRPEGQVPSKRPAASAGWRAPGFG
ncbi:hypothetical protein [Amycolatopsis vancoresmycina]|uniref:hypothetical protein n=1 Tax=Amycolatopsis vancoresmycina TaxID=208444 RepID=UPI00039E776D|nr:hypothetical protein [Amycolatopsis vancoresmycina]